MGLFNFESLSNFITYVKSIVGTSQAAQAGSSWADTLKSATKNGKFVENIKTGTYDATDTVQIGQGRQFTVIEGGAKSAPTVESIYTDSTTKTANINESAAGSVTNGISAKTPLFNVVNGIMIAMGIYHIGIRVSNLPYWKEMARVVFGKEFSADDKIDAVKEFFMQNYNMLISKYTDLVTPSSVHVATYVPQTLIERMYDFLSNYTEANSAVPGVKLVIPQDPNCWIFSPNFELFNRSTYGKRFDKIDLPLPGPAGEQNPTANWRFVNMPVVERISDSLIEQVLQNFIQQMIGAGFTVSDAVATSILSAAPGLCEWYRTNRTYEWNTFINTATYLRIVVTLNRGSTPPPKSTPISANEVYFSIICFNWSEFTDRLTNYQGSDPNLVGSKMIRLQFQRNITYLYPVIMLLCGSEGSATEGQYDNNYAFNMAMPDWTYTNTRNAALLQIGYSGNNPSYSYNGTEMVRPDGTQYTGELFVNGYIEPSDFDNVVSGSEVSYPKDKGFTAFYSNIGYTGANNDYIINSDGEAAGLFSNSEKDTLPAAGVGVATRYPGYIMPNGERSAQVAQTDRWGNPIIKTYIPTVVPAGTTSAEQSLEHGYAGASNPDPAALQAIQNQAAIQAGELPANYPVEDINEAINRLIQEYNDSRYIIDNIPDPYPVPDTEPVPEYPDEPDDTPEGDSGDTPVPGDMETATASGLVSVYNPTKAQLVSFSAWLWSNNFIDNLLKIFQNPMDAIIGLHILYATPSTGSAANIIAGYLDSGVSAKVVTSQFTEINCGTVEVPEYYGTAIDYEPYVQVHCYLPFVGIVALKPNDVLGKELTIKYGVDALTGTCLATLTTEKDGATITCYTYAGNCATQVPISGGNYAQMITGLASMAVSVGAGVATGNPIAVAGGVVAGAMGSRLDVSHSGSIGANAGAMGIRKPYLIITRKKAYNAVAYNEFYGYPANKTVTLGSCKGYTRVKSVHIDSICIATDNEKLEIETLLKQGVIIK